MTLITLMAITTNANNPTTSKNNKGKAVSVFLGKLSDNDNDHEPRTIKPQPNIYSLRCVDTRPRAHPTETQ